MVGRKERKKATRNDTELQQLQQPQVRKFRSDKPEKWKIFKIPRRFAVTLTTEPDSSATYAEVMCKARYNIDLSETGIPDVRFRRSQADEIVLEILGKDNAT